MGRMNETTPSGPDAIPLWQADAFTDRPFAGNPAAVCLLPRPADAGWMQRLAAEMNLSETAFLVRRPEADKDLGGVAAYDLRWFTPTAEVDLCGHATLASAHVLWDSGTVPPTTPVRFHTKSGELTAQPAGEGWIEMDFPAEPVAPWDESPRSDVAAALRRPVDELRQVTANRLDVLVEVTGEGVVRELQPDLRKISELTCRGVIVTAAATAETAATVSGEMSGASMPGGVDFVSRYFAPRFGVPEDPVTGSAHCALGPFWAERLGREELVGYQASPRGGVVRVRLAEGGKRVRLAGQAVTVFRGELWMGVGEE
jgi:PhzF family phenazine biosynthesis protein